MMSKPTLSNKINLLSNTLHKTLLTFYSYLVFVLTIKLHLKSPVAYYLMLLYITVMLKPLIPIIADVWEHEFNEVEHLSLVHEKYGSHHLQKELEESNPNDDHDKSSNTLKSDDQVPFHVLVEEYKSPASSTTFDKRFMLSKHVKLLSVSISREGPPPKFI